MSDLEDYQAVGLAQVLIGFAENKLPADMDRLVNTLDLRTARLVALSAAAFAASRKPASQDVET